MPTDMLVCLWAFVLSARYQGELILKILDLLAKLGILRFGVKSGTYHSGKDRPAEFLIDGVYDAEKDLTHAEDLKKPTGSKDGSD